MKRRSLKLALSIAGVCFVAVMLLLSIDAFLAVDRLNPLPTAEAAAARAGWDVNLIHLRSLDASGGPFGASAVVRYGFDDPNGAEFLEVHLRRPILSSRWEVVAVNTK